MFSDFNSSPEARLIAISGEWACKEDIFYRREIQRGLGLKPVHQNFIPLEAVSMFLQRLVNWPIVVPRDVYFDILYLTIVPGNRAEYCLILR